MKKIQIISLAIFLGLLLHIPIQGAHAFQEDVCRKLGNAVAYFYGGFSSYNDKANSLSFSSDDNKREVPNNSIEAFEADVEHLEEAENILINELSPSLGVYLDIGCPLKKLQNVIVCIEIKKEKNTSDSCTY